MNGLLQLYDFSWNIILTINWSDDHIFKEIQSDSKSLFQIKKVLYTILSKR
jgi:hypothetical protein